MNAIARFADHPPVLEVKNLKVSFRLPGGFVHVVRDVSFQVHKGECFCLVGESGCGKSVTAQTLMGILPVPPARIDDGQVLFNDIELIRLSTRQRRRINGKELAMIFQDPLASLNPTMTVSAQIAEMLSTHTRLDRMNRRLRIMELLDLVGIPEPVKRLKQYPHELSGGMRQRVMIAIALACNPKVLIADEPTTALDVSVQAQILSLLRRLAQQLDLSIVLITHDLGVVAQMADRVAVMYAGKIVEEGPVDDVFYAPKHPYTIALQHSIPKRSSQDPLEYIRGTPPDLSKLPPGCSFAARCANTMKICHVAFPDEISASTSRVSCWLHHNLAEKSRKGSTITRIQENQPVRTGL